MSTESELPSIVRTLNTITTAGETRSAIGSAAVALHRTYPVAKTIADDARRAAAHNELDQARIALERWFDKIVPNGQTDFRDEWRKNRHLVERAYIVVSGVEGTAGYTPRTSHWEILRESVREGLGDVKTFVKETTGLVGEGVGGLADAAGSGIGSLFKGLLGGLGFSGVFWLVVIGLAVFAFGKRGTLIGKAGGLIGKVLA